MLTITNASKAHGSLTLFENLSWSVFPGQKIGFVGRNGAGKTTLLRCIAGLETLSSGEISTPRGTTIAYIEQFGGFEPDMTVMEETLTAFSHLQEMEAGLREMEHRMGDPEVHNDEKAFERLMRDYDHLSVDFQGKGGYEFHARAEAILHGLGFKEEQFGLPMKALSGGQQRKVSLARMLASEPDILLLDEPTNHLDLDATLWLENYLKEYPKAVILISHDRYMLNNVVGKIAELEFGKIREYPGNFDAYREGKAEYVERELKRFEEQQAFIDRTQAFIRKNIAGQKTKQAKSRLKMLERMDIVDRPKVDTKTMNLDLDFGHRGGKVVVKAENAAFRWPEKVLFQNVNFKIYRGERVGLLGPNGAGKSTLVKLMLQQLQPWKGVVELGYNITVGYYDQKHEDLNDKNTILEEVWRVNTALMQKDVRSFLGKMLFPGQRAEQPIASLSGGERSRVVLAKLILRHPNFLILDEPTNHLDIPSIEVMEEALLEYDGTILLITHDRNLLDNVADRLLLFRDGTVEEFLGSYTEWKEAEEKGPGTRDQETREKEQGAGSRDQGKKPQGPENKPKRKEEGQKKSHPPKKKKLRPPDLIQQEIEVIEKTIAMVERQFSDPAIFSDHSELLRLQAWMTELSEKKDILYREWEESERSR